jgi:hypothetical protein
MDSLTRVDILMDPGWMKHVVAQAGSAKRHFGSRGYSALQAAAGSPLLNFTGIFR